ncbi:citrate synthase/methylcitrate synthase [Bacillus sp. RAR_GA_16]|uniref:citrate synthase/methylcitrate synthase n=1 Tax=Bacillus sp. RAR_GA_16 TaxID=2876774 RepID=UPI001CCE0724|nr:citrate synthase/methylcitrate synthase [Bacillus sp. RAR_GA_16]MCA0173278.1 citrate synthase/methylcitrate synthase [Bacillus sp. RAR_GA_16]
MIHAGLEGIVAADSKISLVDGENGLLVYRGEWAKQIAKEKSFEEATYFLWNGDFPNKDELDTFTAALKEARTLSPSQKEIINRLPENMEMMSVVRTVISSIGHQSYQFPATQEQGIQLLSIVPTIIAYRYRNQKGLPIIEPDGSLSHVGNYLYMLKGRKPQEHHVKALTAYFILTMEHGLNASTFTARVIASTESDLASSITGAIGAMKGPLHGGAPTGVIDLLDEIKQDGDVEKVLRQKLENREKLMGFGHRVYKTRDPRAAALSEITSDFYDDEEFQLAHEVEETAVRLLQEYKPDRKLYANVEYYAAAILRAIELPTELFTPTFTAARTAGWIAHVYEQNENNRIIRPSSVYSGSMPE